VAISPPGRIEVALIDDSESVPLLLHRVRAGDPEAAAELVRRYEPLIRARVHVWLRLNHPGLLGELESVDICQSVLRSFFVRAAAGQYELERPEQLAGLLVRMARHKLLDQVKYRHAGRRDVRRNEPLGADPGELAAREPDATRVLIGRELLEQVRSRLAVQERRAADLRGEGHTWAEVAGVMGGTPDGHRMQLARALDRVARELGIDEGDLGG
jgi:DNA-directed RNA polymerase specialized sigma24 family protein